MNLNDYFYCDVPSKSSWNYTYDVLPPIEEEMNGGESIDDDLDNTNELICWGCGEFGQHGHTTKEDVAFQDGALYQFHTDSNNKVKAVSCGASHTLVVTNSDEVYSWGNGNSGQLGKEGDGSISQAHRVELFDTKSKNPPTCGVACGARHSMVWLQNGNVFSFGNNFYAQLGYDFRQKNYKENQTKPYLLKFLVYRPVAQLACGEKHSVFRFQNGAIACVGSNVHGQIGMGNRMEAVVPKFLEMDDNITYVACGANHSMAITDEGEIYLWGYGKACGDKTNDILSPERQMTRKKNVVQVAGGSNHSMALTASGSVYTWGSGSEGQLGFGDKVWFLSEPQRLVYKALSKNIVQIACGDSYSAAITENGELYMWGKNSHVIYPGKPTSLKVWQPHCVNKGKQPVKSVYCGSWHAAAITGFPDLLSCIDGDSGISDLEQEDIITTAPPTTTLMLRNVKVNEKSVMENQEEQNSSSDESEIDDPDFQRETTSFQREHTKQTLAEFYAPTPDIKKQYDVPSPSFYEDKDDDDNYGDGVNKHYDMDDDVRKYEMNSAETRSRTGSARSSRLVVSVPHQKGGHDYVDVGTSPIPFSSSASESENVESLKEVKVNKTVNKKTNKKKTVIANKQDSQYYEDQENSYTGPGRSASYDRHKTVHNVPPPSYIQTSKSTADSFLLPRENTTLTRTQIDFKEMDKLKQWTSNSYKPEKHAPRFGRIYDSPVNRIVETNSQARTHSEGSHRHLVYAESPASSRAGEASLHKVSSYGISYGRIIDSPLGRSGRHSETAILNIMRQEQGLDRLPSKLMLRTSESSLADYGRPQNTPEYMDDAMSLKARLPPRPYHAPSMPKKNTELNFGLQISRNNTFIGPVKNSKTTTNINQFQRYANVHNPSASSTKNTETKNKLGLVTPRNVSIPANRVPVIQEEADNLCVHGLTGGRNARQPIYSSASSWRDKSDIEKMHAASRNKSQSVSPHSLPSLESPDYKNIHERGFQDMNSDARNYGNGDYDGLPVGRNESDALELNSDNKVSLTKRHEKKNNLVSTFQLDSHIDLDAELTDLKIETTSSKGFHNRKNGLFPASISQTS